MHRCMQMATRRIYVVKVLWIGEQINASSVVSYPSIFILTRPSMVWWANSCTCYRRMPRTKWSTSGRCATLAARSLALSKTSAREITVCITLSTISFLLSVSCGVLIYGNLGYIVMQKADNGDLDSQLSRTFTEEEVADIMLDIFTGLDILHHDLGVAHRGMFSLSLFFFPHFTSDHSPLPFRLAQQNSPLSRFVFGL